MAKSCPITRKQFREHAKQVEVVVNGVPMIAQVKEFSTGSLGWNISSKTNIDVGGTPVSVQIGLNLTIVGSKDLPKDAAATSDAPVTDDEDRAGGVSDRRNSVDSGTNSGR